MNPLLTIIIPVYNVEKYLDTCLKSIVNQTLNNHKVVLVNDGSTDDSGLICQKYTNKYPEMFTYLEQENKGQGEARNNAMKYVSTPYISFIDSDDWLDVRYVECFTKLIDDLGIYPDMVLTLPWIYNSVTKWLIPWYDKDIYDRVFEVHDGISSVRTNAKLRPELYAMEVSSCRKIYNTAFLKRNNFAFPTGVKWEDVPGHFYLLHRADLCVAMPEASFFYRTEHGNSTTSRMGKTRLDVIPILGELYEIINKDNFEQIEKSFTMSYMVKFARWFIDVTKEEYLEELLKGLHEVFCRFSEDDITNYLVHAQTNSVDENMRLRGFLTCIRSNDYLSLKNYDTREDEMMNYSIKGTENLKRMIKTGKQLLREQGILYTTKETVNKFSKRKA